MTILVASSLALPHSQHHHHTRRSLHHPEAELRARLGVQPQVRGAAPTATAVSAAVRYSIGLCAMMRAMSPLTFLTLSCCTDHTGSYNGTPVRRSARSENLASSSENDTL
eukprot:CAMPEP_0197596714 /NCGR_PEP_ID=MMETSP1326-20131121/25732_1 /TAXON_ID=1155430 /ORGANISM="Genus nov. species nov., Strain RCC2288" /LENGTH=109 /DNA_ID=CAMNT_0043163271 /DNA_START=83 /DNA_END=413 /DNA_ORIENTATION=+